MATQTITVKDARNRFAELIERAAIAGDTFVITKFGKTKAVIAPPSGTGKKPKATPAPSDTDTAEVLAWTRSFITQYRPALETLAKK